MTQERIVAVGLLTRGDVQRLGDNFKRLWPVDETPCFAGLLEAIDAADREVRRERPLDAEDARAQSRSSPRET